VVELGRGKPVRLAHIPASARSFLMPATGMPVSGLQAAVLKDIAESGQRGQGVISDIKCLAQDGSCNLAMENLVGSDSVRLVDRYGHRIEVSSGSAIACYLGSDKPSSNLTTDLLASGISVLAIAPQCKDILIRTVDSITSKSTVQVIGRPPVDLLFS